MWCLECNYLIWCVHNLDTGVYKVCANEEQAVKLWKKLKYISPKSGLYYK